MERTKNSRLKKIMLAAAAVLVVVSLTAGLTIALLSDTDSKENTFPGSPAIKLQLNEPKWDGYTDGSGDGTTANPAYAGADTLGLTIAQSYQPNSVIPKNPALTNTSDDSTVNNEYVAMKVVYQVRTNTTGDVATQGDFVDVTYDQFSRIAAIDFDTAAWNKTATSDKADIYCYGSTTVLTAVAKAATTSELFTNVTVGNLTMDPNNETTLDLGSGVTVKYAANSLPEFRVLVYGSAIQADNNSDTYANNTAALAALFA